MYIALNKWLTDIKSLLSTVYFLSKNYSSAEVEYLLIRCSKTEFFLQNTNNADRIGVNIHNTNTKTKHSEKDTASLKRVSMKMGERVGGLTMQWKHHYDLNLLFIYIIYLHYLILRVPRLYSLFWAILHFTKSEAEHLKAYCLFSIFK